MSGLPWDHVVEFYTSGAGGDLTVRRTRMTLREAVDLFAALPEAQQRVSGAGSPEPLRVEWEGRPIFIGWLSSETMRRLVEGADLSTPPPRLPNRIDQFPPIR